jgi:hypothetical protein
VIRDDLSGYAITGPGKVIDKLTVCWSGIEAKIITFGSASAEERGEHPALMLVRADDRIMKFSTAVQNVSLWPVADIERSPSNVRFWGQSGPHN